MEKKPASDGKTVRGTKTRTRRNVVTKDTNTISPTVPEMEDYALTIDKTVFTGGDGAEPEAAHTSTIDGTILSKEARVASARRRRAAGGRSVQSGAVYARCGCRPVLRARGRAHGGRLFQLHAEKGRKNV